MERPQTTAILAMSADGKIADCTRAGARFASLEDKSHLESLIALMDAVLLGGGTLRAYGTTLTITQAQLLEQRQSREQPPQPVHLICSVSGNIDPKLRFFAQSVPQWLLTGSQGADLCKNHLFKRILVGDFQGQTIDWSWAFRQFSQLGWQKLGILGGGELVASLIEADLVDEFYLTICPLILGGKTAPTPVDGWGWPVAQARQLELLGVKAIGSEIFLHYRRS